MNTPSREDIMVQKSAMRFDGAEVGGISALADYKVKRVLNKDILVEYIDESDGENLVNRGGILVSTVHTKNTFRVGRVLMIGDEVDYANVGEIVIFPDNKGIPISNIAVKGYEGKIAKAIFLDKDRIFCIAE